MSGKTVSFPSKPKTAADEWIEQGAAEKPATATLETRIYQERTANAGRMKRFTIDVSEELHARIKIACAERGMVMADEIRRLLEAAFPEKRKS
jgi:hypothetical protein